MCLYDHEKIIMQEKKDAREIRKFLNQNDCINFTRLKRQRLSGQLVIL